MRLQMKPLRSYFDATARAYRRYALFYVPKGTRPQFSAYAENEDAKDKDATDRETLYAGD